MCSATVWPEANQDDCHVVADYARECSHWRQVPSQPTFCGPDSSECKKGRWQSLFHLFTPRNTLLEEALHPYDGLTDRHFKQDHLHDRVISSCTIRNVVFDACSFTHTVFEKVRFLECTFTAIHLRACIFKECTFSRCMFNQGAMHEISMQGCFLEDVEVSRFLFDACSFSRHRLQGGMIDQVALRTCSLERGAVDMCLVRRVCWDTCTLSSVRIIGTMVEDAWMSRAEWHGVELVACRLERTHFLGLLMRNARVDDTRLTSCWFEGLDSLEPVFYASWLDSLFWDVCFETGKHDALPESLDSKWVQDVLVAWRYEQVVRTTEQTMLHNNRRRMNLASEKFASGRDDFFRVLPCLLCSSNFEEYMGLQGIPRCTIDGFTPDYSQLCILDKLFPSISERSLPDEHTTIVRIAAVYTLGSLGTVAQNSNSDVDVWVCLADSQTDTVMRSRVDMKCEALSRWAREEYDLELHFFVMTLDAIRSNHFGMLSREGSGSAQALLLKEEFYRTALFLGGRPPAWWAIPCWTSRVQEGCVLCPERDARSCDLGEISAIPQEEFFGASLWQIVGSARNPYKALLKLGLLEKYAVQGASLHNMLSEAIKGNLLHGKQEVSQIDPYGLLYHELVLFYSRLGDREGCTLLKESFQSKIRMEEMDLSCGYPRRREEQSLLSLYGPSSRISRDKIAALGKRWSMAKTLERGEAMSSFMIRAYKRIQGKVSARGKDVAIRPEEMTMLGRTILSYFGREPGKVRRMFLMEKDTDYREIYLYGEKTSDGKHVYAAKARREHQPRILESLEVVRRDHNPFRLVAWLAVNKLFRPGVEVSGNPTLAPLSVSFLQGALQGVLETFPPEDVFRVKQEELLEEKRIKKVLCFLQKGPEADEGAVAGADILYSTSWGELYGVHLDHPAATIRTDPLEFFARNLPCPLDWEAKLYQYRTSTGRIMPLVST
nr:class I adenylate cyclase [Desulfoplanes formicivorans]